MRVRLQHALYGTRAHQLPHAAVLPDLLRRALREQLAAGLEEHLHLRLVQQNLQWRSVHADTCSSFGIDQPWRSNIPAWSMGTYTKSHKGTLPSPAEDYIHWQGRRTSRAVSMHVAWHGHQGIALYRVIKAEPCQWLCCSIKQSAHTRCKARHLARAAHRAQHRSRSTRLRLVRPCGGVVLRVIASAIGRRAAYGCCRSSIAGGRSHRKPCADEDG